MGTTMRTNFKIGKAYRIEFLDHCTGSDEEIVCEVFGRVLRQTDVSVVLSWWNILNSDRPTIEANRERVTILKSVIKKKRLLD
jgi:hypothetical protein